MVLLGKLTSVLLVILMKKKKRSLNGNVFTIRGVISWKAIL